MSTHCKTRQHYRVQSFFDIKNLPSQNPSWLVTYVIREANRVEADRVAHCLAKIAISCIAESVCMEDCQAMFFHLLWVKWIVILVNDEWKWFVFLKKKKKFPDLSFLPICRKTSLGWSNHSRITPNLEWKSRIKTMVLQKKIFWREECAFCILIKLLTTVPV